MTSRHRNFSLGLLVVLWGLLAGADGAAAQTAPSEAKTYVVMGTSSVKEGGLNAARERAVGDCKRIAVEQMTAEILPLDLLVQQFAAIDTVIYDQADKFIQYYKMLSEHQQDNQLRVLVQAKVSGRMIQERLRSAGIQSASGRPLVPLSLAVVGSDNLSSFVLFRSTLNNMNGVENVQISEILPNQTTLAVQYRGTAGAFAEALLREPQEGFRIRVYQETDTTFRIDLAPAEAPQPQG